VAEENFQEPEAPEPQAQTPLQQAVAEYDTSDGAFEEDFDLPQQASSVVPDAGASVASAPAQVSPKQKHLRSLVSMAVDLGVPQEEIDAATPDALSNLVYHLNRQQLELARRNSREDALNPRQPAPAPAASAPAAPDDFDTGLPDENEFEPSLVNAVKKIGKASRDKLKALEDRLAKAEANEQQRQQEQVNARVDSLFAGLGKEYEAVVGKGDWRAVSAKDPDAFTRRKAILNMAAQDQSQTSFEDKFAKAAKQLFGGRAAPEPGEVEGYGEVPAGAPPALTQRQREWQEGTVGRPTARGKDSKPKGEKAALQAAAKYMRENNLGDEDELAGFPD
jgi:hypothetical protein